MTDFTPIDFHRRRDFGTKIGITFDFIRQNFKSFGKALIFIAGPPILIGSGLQAMFYNTFMGTILTAGQSGDQYAVEQLFLSVDFWMQFVAALLLFSFGTVVMVSVIYNYMLEYEEKQTNQIEVTNVWNRVKDTLLMYFGTFLLNMFAFVAVAIALVLVIALFMQIAGFVAFIVGAAAYIALIYAFIALSLIFIVRGYERIGYMEALTRCFYLVRGKWWSTFGLLFVLGLLQTVINWILFLPFSIFNVVTALHSIESDPFADPSTFNSTYTTVTTMLSFFTAFLLSSMSTIGVAFQYFNLVEMKEARGLMSKIDSIGQGPSTQQDEHY